MFSLDPRDLPSLFRGDFGRMSAVEEEIGRAPSPTSRTPSELSVDLLRAGSVADTYATVSLGAFSRVSDRQSLSRRSAASVPWSQKLAPTWIEQTFKKRECVRFVRSSKDGNRCGCGRSWGAHRTETGEDGSPAPDPELEAHIRRKRKDSESPERWTIQRCTTLMETDAFGTIEFQGGPHPTKAQYVRLGFDSEPSDILELFRKVWGIKPPKLVITIHGGIANFELQAKLARVFRKGLLKAAKTTGAWIITSGLNTGVVREVAASLSEGLSNRSSSKSRIVTIGIAPWGLLKKRDLLLGKERTVAYHPRAFSPRGKFAVLNDKHNYFLLVDNGTVGRYGADIILRKRLEEYISNQPLDGYAKRRGGFYTGGKKVPVVCVVLEGGQVTIRAVLDYVTNVPPVPVVVCDGSGRAADLLAFTHQHTAPHQSLAGPVKEQLLGLVGEVFGCSNSEARNCVQELQLCVRKRNLMTVFRLGEDQQADVDHAILTALLKSHGSLSPGAQLSLALAWNRADIARSEIFVPGTDWPTASLDSAMMEALVEDRVEFVKLLLENGVSMERFLTFQRLEELYNTPRGPPSTLKTLVRSVTGSKGYISLQEIGLLMEKLMGSAYMSRYCSREFLIKYNLWKQFKSRLLAGDLKNPGRIRRRKWAASGTSNLAIGQEDDTIHGSSAALLSSEPDFAYPFNELLVWAVLSKRPDMARCMWQHGEEALAKALVAAQLNRSMAAEAAQDQVDLELRGEFLKSVSEFRRLGLELLDHSYHANRSNALRLLTYELRNWGGQTCLSLAVIGGHKDLVAHTVCQTLLGDLWHGGLAIRKNANLKVIMGLLCPPLILRLEFKTKDELLLQPQTAEEHADEMREWSDSSSSSSSTSSPDSSDSDETGAAGDPETGRKRKRTRASRLWRAASTLSVSSHLGTNRSRQASIVGHAASAAVSPVTGVRVEAPSPARSDPLTRSLRMSGRAALQRLRQLSSSFRKADEKAGSRERQVVFASNSLPMKASKALSDSGDVKSMSEASSPGESRKRRHLNARKKLYEFYVAPITTYWFFLISYLIFLCTFTYVCLVKTPPEITLAEIYIASFVITFGFDIMSKILTLEPRGLRQKVQLWMGRGWNILKSLCVCMYLAGLALRVQSNWRSTGRVVLNVNIIFWYIELLEIVSVNAALGVYINMMTKMIRKAAGLLLILMVVLTAFGIAWQAIRFPAQDWHWQLLRNVFYKPYFMLYGEVYAGEIDECGDEDRNCVPGVWLAPLAMFFFLLAANILLINLIIAVFNNVFQHMNAQSQQLWRFTRYFQVMEYEASPPFPPPLIILCDLYRIGKRLRRWFRARSLVGKQEARIDLTLKLFLSEEDMEDLHDFEEECMDDLHQEKIARKAASQEEKVSKTNDRVEYMAMKILDIMSREQATKSAVLDLEKKLGLLEDQIQGLNNELVHKDELFLKVEDLQGHLRMISNRLDTPKPSHGRSASMDAVAQRPASPGEMSKFGVRRRNRRSPLHSPGLPPPLFHLKANAPTSFTSELLDSLPAGTSDPGLYDAELRALSPPDSRTRLRRLHSFQDPGDLGPGDHGSPPKTPLLLRRQRKRSGEAFPGDPPIVGPSGDGTRARQGVEDPARTSTPDSRAGPSQNSRDSSPDSRLGRARSVPADTSGSGAVGRKTSAGVTSARKPVLQSLHSCPAPGDQRNISPSLLLRSPAVRHRRNEEYTSITDRIDLGNKAELAEPRLSFIQEEPSPSNLLGSGSSQAIPMAERETSPSYVVEQNDVLREFEKEGSRITGGLIGGRIRRESARVDTGALASNEELRDMGLNDVDVCDYLAVLEGANVTPSSSQESLTSNKMEDEEGFQQINECIAIAQAHSRQGSELSAEPLIPHAASNPVLLASPRLSPSGSKAGQMFTFDVDELRTFVETQEAVQKRNKASSSEDDC